MTARYRVYARDVSRRNLGEIPDFERLTAQLRFNDVGGWTLSATAASRTAALMSETGGIIITRDNLDGSGPGVVFSGLVTRYELDANRLEVGGVSDEQVLNDRPGSPDPTTEGPPYVTEADLRDGTCSTIMLEYVKYNAVPGFAAGSRAIAGLEVGVDHGLGEHRFGQPRWVSLLSLEQELASLDGLRFQVLQSDRSTATITFTVTQPLDRSGIVVISEGRGTLGAWKRVVNRPSATAVVTLGQGQGVNRIAVRTTDGAASSRWGHEIEIPDDRRDISDPEALAQASAAALIDSSEDVLVAYTPRDVPSLRWGIDYDLGDLVTVVLPTGEILQEIVRGVDLTLTTPDSQSAAAEVQAIISTPGDAADDPASRQQRRLTRRVSRLATSVDNLNSVVLGLWNVGNMRMTATSVAAAGWLLCDGSAVSRTTYHALYGVIGTTYGAGDGSTTFNVPDLRGRFPIGKSGSTSLGDTGGSDTFDLSHDHDAGTLLGPSHGHDAGTLLGPSHTHAAGTLTVPNHSHAAGTLTVPNHSHAAGTLAGPSHDHSGSSLSITGGTGVAQAGNFYDEDDTGNGYGTRDALHTHDSGTLDVAGNTASGGSGSVTGSTASDGTTTVTGATASDGTTTATGSTASGGNGSVTGTTAAAGTGPVTGATAEGLSVPVTILPPFLVINFEIYAGV